MLIFLFGVCRVDGNQVSMKCLKQNSRISVPIIFNFKNFYHPAFSLNISSCHCDLLLVKSGIQSTESIIFPWMDMSKLLHPAPSGTFSPVDSGEFVPV